MLESPSLGSKPGSTNLRSFDLGQGPQPLCASVSSSEKWGNSLPLPATGSNNNVHKHDKIARVFKKILFVYFFKDREKEGEREGDIHV